MSSPPASPPPGEPRKRKRRILNLYYGVGEKSDIGEKSVVDPCNIDGPHFDAKAYLDKQLQACQLPQLLQLSQKVSSELGSLDGDMQTLVYENYNKFISATDTIRQMKSKVESMEEEMRALDNTMQTINGFSEGINAALKDKHTRIAKLSSVHLLLKKLQFLFELPARLKRCVEMKAYKQAVQYYVKATGILNQYKHMKSFGGIQAECRVIVADLERILNEQLRELDPCSGGTAAKVTECVDMLLDLGAAPEELCDAFLAKARSRLMGVLEMLEGRTLVAFNVDEEARRKKSKKKKNVEGGDGEGGEGGKGKAKKKKKSMLDDDGLLDNIDEDDDDDELGAPLPLEQLGDEAAEQPQSQTETIVSLMTLVGSTFLDDILDLSRTYRQLFLTSSSSNHPSSDSTPSSRRTSTSTSTARVCSPAVVAVAAPKLAEFALEMIPMLFTLVKQRLQAAAVLEEDNSGALVRAMDRFYMDMLRLHRLLPTAGFKLGANAVVRGGILARLRESQSRLQRYFDESIVRALAQRSNQPTTAAQPHQKPASEGDTKSDDAMTLPLAQWLPKLAHQWTERIKHTLIEHHSFLSSAYASNVDRFREQLSFRRIRLELIQDGVLHWQCERALHIADTVRTASNDDEYRPLLLVLLCRFFLCLESNGVSSILKHTEDLFPLSIKPAQQSESGALPVGDLMAQAKVTAQRLVNLFVEVQGTLTSQLVRKSIETRDWLTTPEPRNVRSVMKRVVEEITVADDVVSSLFDADPSRGRSSESSRRTRVPNADPSSATDTQNHSSFADTALLSNIQRLFLPRIDIFAEVDFTRQSVLTGIVKICIKTLFECVRLRTFSRFGLQQIQIDTHYLKMHLWRFVSDESILDTLLEEVMTSTVDRCLDPSRMDSSVVQAVCNRVDRK